MQKLALFDLDGTLLDRHAAFGDAITGLCAHHDYGADIQHWLLTELGDRAYSDDFVRLCSTFALSDPAGWLWQDYVDRMAASLTCRPAVLEGLALLRTDGWTIGIVTNGAADIQRAKLAASGINALTDGIAVSGDLEIRKPDARLFHLAATRCRVRLADGGWMIGDNPSTDIRGGHQAGLHTIWVRGRPWPTDVLASHQTVDDVLDAINFLLTTSPE